MQKQSKITRKGQITVPIEVRRILGVQAGDRLLFETDSNGVHIRPVFKQSAFAKYCGIGNPGIPSGKKGINRWLREMRGHID
jgi:AbrB family looped-hinge helix DNA binding protein